MPRRAQGPRLWLQNGYHQKDGFWRGPVWVIRDGGKKVSTGVVVEDRRRPPQDARDALEAYFAEGRATPRDRERNAASVLVALRNQHLLDGQGPKTRATRRDRAARYRASELLGR